MENTINHFNQKFIEMEISHGKNIISLLLNLIDETFYVLTNFENYNLGDDQSLTLIYKREIKRKVSALAKYICGNELFHSGEIIHNHIIECGRVGIGFGHFDMLNEQSINKLDNLKSSFVTIRNDSNIESKLYTLDSSVEDYERQYELLSNTLEKYF